MYKYKNLKLRLLHFNANIYFSKKCLESHFTPKCAKLNLPNRNVREKNTKGTGQYLYIKNEIKFWYKKKQNLNDELHKVHLENANRWKPIWPPIKGNINHSLEFIMKKIENLHKKLTNLTQIKHKTPPKIIELSIRE
jgi:hypothetical protein